MWTWLTGWRDKLMAFLTKTQGGQILRDSLADLVQVMGPVAVDILAQLALNAVGAAEVPGVSGADKAAMARNTLMGSPSWASAKQFAATQGVQIGTAEANRLVELAVGKLRSDQRARPAP